MTQTLNVEYQELMARADEIEQPLPTIPLTNPPGPCALSFVQDAATQIALSADSMRLYLKACEREWKSLAKSLRNAAKAYEEVDEGSAEAINKEGSASGGASASVGGDDAMSAFCDPDEDYVPPPPPPPPPPFQYPYYEVRQAATDIEAGDQGLAFKAFAGEWDAFQRQFQRETYRFRPFTSWEGESRTLVEQNFELQRQWIYAMVQLCVNLGSQALRVVDAHKKARVLGQHVTYGADGKYAIDAEHPTSYEVSQCDYWYKYYTQKYSEYLYMAISWYESLQAKSETSLGIYVTNASIPLAPINPKAPPTATVINAPLVPPGPNDPDKPDNPTNPDIPIDPETPDPFDDSKLPDPTGMPSTPSAGMPTTPTAASDTSALNDTLKDALKGGSGLPTGAGLKPASLGGGGGGMPSMPLQPAVDAGAAAGPAGAPPGAAASAGRGMPGGAGAMGGGMGGMAPMGGGQGQQNAGKGKRVQSDEEALYTEERQWTEGVIGNRPRKAGPEK
jgi:ESX secretion-associated protein EspB